LEVTWLFSAHDRVILRDLAKEVAEIAALPVMAERKRLWYLHNSLKQERPMVLIFPEGSWQELLPPAALQCEGERARQIEYALRQRIYGFRHFQSDNVVEDIWQVHIAVRLSSWGLTSRRHNSPGERGAWAFDPVILEPSDLKKLVVPEVSIDEAATERALAEAQELFGDILKVRLVGVNHISFHLMAQYTAWRGLEQVMLDMYENPGMLHDAMAFLEEAHRSIVKQYVDLNVLSLNNDNTYHSSGGVGYTDELPKPGFHPNHVRPCDMWASAEAQEMAQVSPEMHDEFILAYEKRLLAPFGLNGYGCCEDLTRKLPLVFTIPNLRRVSISPFADVEACAAQIGNRCIFSWKPHPSHLVGAFDPARIRDYVAHGIKATRGCTLEIILKDTHTCEHRPERFDQWSDIVYRLVTGGVS
jgi:hypothetical protein